MKTIEELITPDMSEVEILKLKLAQAEEDRDIYFKAWVLSLQTQMANYSRED